MSHSGFCLDFIEIVDLFKRHPFTYVDRRICVGIQRPVWQPAQLVFIRRPSLYKICIFIICTIYKQEKFLSLSSPSLLYILTCYWKLVFGFFFWVTSTLILWSVIIFFVRLINEVIIFYTEPKMNTQKKYSWSNLSDRKNYSWNSFE